MRSSIVRALGAAAVAAFAAACTTVDAAPAGAPATNVVTVTAGDYFYQMPDTLPAGLTSFRLLNRGTELHHIQAVRLEQGKTLQDLMAHMAAGPGAPPAWAVDVGGPNTPAPGEETEATFELKPGTYAILCFIPSPDGKPHVMKGMMKQVTVVPGSAPSAAAPKVDATVVLDDYSFDITPTLEAGRQVIRVENRAAQAHEIVLVQLAPGRTPHDMVSWLEKPAGPPPGRPVGGTTGLAKGMVNYVTADLAAGEYALLCFIPDAKDGKPHVAHGMVKQITIR
jgi:uncharacterized cupredoxin-like copper-binding protein